MAVRHKRRPRTVVVGDIVQIRFGATEQWLDYATIGDGDIEPAIGRVDRGIHEINLEGKRAEFRIVRRYMGLDVIRGPRV